MTRERIEQLKALLAKVEQIKAMPCEVIEPYTYKFLCDAHFHMPALLALAEEALELREALEWLWEQRGADVTGNLRRDGDRCIAVIRRQRGQTIEILFYGEGSTPLEAIKNARRGA